MPKSNPLDRAFQILDIVASADRVVTLVEVVQISGLPQSSTFRLLTHLVESGMLAFDKGNKAYSIGARANRLSLFIAGQKTLKTAVLPVLDALAKKTGEAAFFVIADQNRNHLLDFAVPERGATSFIHPGFEFPMHATAAGKVIQAFGSGRGVHVPANYDFKAFQPNTISDEQQLKTTLEQVRSDGFAINDSELDDDVFSVCVPVFYRDTLAGALGAVGPKNRASAGLSKRLAETIDLLKSGASEVTALLEHSNGFAVNGPR